MDFSCLSSYLNDFLFWVLSFFFHDLRFASCVEDCSRTLEKESRLDEGEAVRGLHRSSIGYFVRGEGS